MNTQLIASNTTLSKMIAEQQRIIENLSFLESTPLKQLLLDHKYLVHDNQLYGTVCHVSFTATSDLVNDLITMLENGVLEIEQSLKGSGTWRYDQFPLSYKHKLLEKDSKLTVKGGGEYLAKLNVKGYSISFYVWQNDSIIKVSLDFSNLICAEYYSSSAKGYEIPHLVNNTRYTKNGRNGSQYFVKNNPYLKETNNYELYSMPDKCKLLPLLRTILKTN